MKAALFISLDLSYSLLMSVQQVKHSGRFHQPWGIHEWLKSLCLFGTAEWNAQALPLHPPGWLESRSWFPPVSLSAWRVLRALWSVSPRAPAICRRQISIHADRAGAGAHVWHAHTHSHAGRALVQTSLATLVCLNFTLPLTWILHKHIYFAEEVMFSPTSFRLLVGCLSTGLRKNYQTDFNGSWWEESGIRAKDEPIKY